MKYELRVILSVSKELKKVQNSQVIALSGMWGGIREVDVTRFTTTARQYKVFCALQGDENHEVQ